MQDSPRERWHAAGRPAGRRNAARGAAVATLVTEGPCFFDNVLGARPLPSFQVKQVSDRRAAQAVDPERKASAG